MKFGNHFILHVMTNKTKRDATKIKENEINGEKKSNKAQPDGNKCDESEYVAISNRMPLNKYSVFVQRLSIV